MKSPPIYTFSDTLDAGHVVGVARCYVLRRGWVYGLSVFVIHDEDPKSPWSSRRDARDRAEARLRDVVAKDCGGCLPAVGKLREFGGEGVDLTW